MTLEKEFVPYTESFELKELGFDEPCFGYHLCKNSALGVYLEITTEWIDLLPYDSSSCKAPTFSQAFRWFREKYNLCHQVISAGRDGEFNAFVRDYIYGNNGKYSPSIFTYEEAELACLRKLIQIVKEKTRISR